MSRLEIVPFSDEHLEDAAGLLAARHARHREAEPLLPELEDPVAAVENDWRADGASGVFRQIEAIRFDVRPAIREDTYSKPETRPARTRNQPGARA